MAIATEDLRFRVLAQVLGAQAIGGLKNQLDGIGKSSAGVQKNFQFLANSLKTLGVAYAASQGITFAKSLLNLGDQLDELSQKTGVSASDLAKFKTTAEQSGVPLESLAKSLSRLARSTVEAATGSKEAKAAFASVGVAALDINGKARPTADVLKDLADRFSNMRDGPEKAAVAMKIFGKSGADLIPFLNQGAAGISKFGLAISDDFAARAGAFNDTLDGFVVSAKNLGISILSDLLPTFQEIANEFKDSADSSSSLKELWMGFGEAVRLLAIAFEGLVLPIKTVGDAIIQLSVDVIDRSIVRFKTFVNTISSVAAGLIEFGRGNFKGLSEARGAAIAENERIEAEYFARSKKRLEDFSSRFDQNVQKSATSISRLSKNSLLLGEGSVDEILKRQRDSTAPDDKKKDQAANIDALTKARTAERDRIKEFIEQQTLENKQREQALEDINLTSLELLKVTEARKLESEAVKAGKTMTAEQRAELMKATEEIIKQRTALIDLEQQQKRSFGYGLKDGLRSYVDEATNVGKQISESVKRSFTAMEDALLDFVTTGKLNFTEFANSIIKDLARIAIRQAVTAPLASGLGSIFSGFNPAAASPGLGGGTSFGASPSPNIFEKGGIMTSRGSVPLRAYARGGVANSPQLALFGEGSRPEAYVPLPDGRNIPVKMQGGGSNFEINVMVSADGSTSATGSSEQGKQLGTVIAAAVRSELIAQKRPGGILA